MPRLGVQNRSLQAKASSWLQRIGVWEFGLVHGHAVDLRLIERDRCFVPA